jgi:hypothetical protein
MYTTTGVYTASVPMPGPTFSGDIFAYLALIDPTVSAPALCISPDSTLSFFYVNVGASSDLQVTITNCGTLPLTISSISSAAAVFTCPCL